MKPQKILLLLFTFFIIFISAEQKKIKIDNINVDCEIIGEGIPVIMVHGFGIDSNLLKGCMEPVFNNKKGYKRIYFDLPGMGKTKAPEGYENSDDILAFVQKIIEKTVDGEKYIIVGNSYGGYLSRGVIHEDRENTIGALLICPMNIPERSRRNLPEKSVVCSDTNFINSLRNNERRIFQSLFVDQTKANWDRFEKEILPSLDLADFKFLSALQNEENYCLTFNPDEIEFFDKPALILSGRQDHIVGFSDVMNYFNKYKRATFAVLDIAGHNLHIEQARLFNILVEDFLDRIKIYEN